jgi:xanthine dehydrogenase molybdenum-binding subunit
MYDRPTHLPQPTSLRLRLLADGRVEAQVAIMETGTGSHTMLQRVLAKELQLDPDRVVVRYVGTPFLPYDEGVGGSRVTVGTAEAGTRAARAFRAELASRAASLLDATADAVELQPGGVLRSVAGREVDLAGVAARGIAVEAMGEITSHERGDALTSFCAQAAQVAVDVETGEVTLLDFVSAHDVAEIISPVQHRGQIEGGIVMGLGFALCEDLGVVEGRVTAAHLGDYKLPTMADVPPLKVVLIPGARGVGPQNVKSIGEISNVPAAAAVANAVSNALGVCMDSLPLTAEKVLAAIQSQRA